MNQKSSVANLFLGLALFCNALTMIIAAAISRPLFMDGTLWLTKLLSEGRLYYDETFCRYFSTIWQIPSLLVIKAFPQSDLTWLAVDLYSYCYALHPILSLVLCYWILSRKRRIDLFLFPLLSFALGTQTTMMHSTAVITDALTVFWPLLLLTLLQNKNSTIELVLILLMSVAMAFTYELAFFFFLVLLAAKTWNFKSNGSLTIQEKISIAAFTCGALWLLWRGIGPHSGSRSSFLWSVTSGYIKEFRLLTFAMLIFWMLCFIGKLATRLLLVISYVSLLGAVTAYATGFYSGDIFDSFFSRTTVVPVVLAISIMTVFSANLPMALALRKDVFSNELKIAVACVLFCSAGNDALLNIRWSRSVEVVID